MNTDNHGYRNQSDLSDQSDPANRTVTPSRRNFLITAATTISGFSAAALSFTGCASTPLMLAAPRNGRISVPLASWPVLQRLGGCLQIQAEQVAYPIWLVNTDGSTLKAYSAVCSHMGCFVAWAGRIFQCPCHGSAYDIDGNVIRGPAPAALTQLRVEAEPEMVHILLGG
jgi:Rieske Fe-S protein